MPSVEKIAQDIVAREGGYVHDPDDPGGATQYGVTIGTMRRLGLDIDKDGDVDGADLKTLTPERAAALFLKHYFYQPRIDDLPPALQASVFDMHVNAGIAAVKILQRLLAAFDQPLRVDGVIGPATHAAAQAAYAQAPDHLPDAYGIARRNYYYALADRRPASRKYARRRDGGKGGWIVRAEEFIAPKYHLTLAQHRERTRSWG